ncbi:MAG: hypothetical protein RQ757_01640 [Pseudomonadales bacterium]|nr:hypothetical protein [Pseudomonadales bacterium]
MFSARRLSISADHSRGQYRFLLISGLLLLTACGQAPQQAETPAATEAIYNTSNDIPSLMNLVIEPVADSLWGSAGWILSDAGYEELYPTTDEGWDFVYSQSATIVELGNLLALPERTQGRETWLTYAQAMSDVGEIAMQAVSERDNEAYFQAGAQLYSVCTACHQAYNTEISRFVSN